MDIQLQLRNHAGVIGPASDFAYKWGLNAGLSREKALHLALAVDEIVSDVVQFAFPGEEATFDLTFRYDLATTEVIIRERGEPFDPDRHPYNRDRALADGNFVGAGFEIIRHCVDDFAFLNKGWQGKEFRLVQHIESDHIAELHPAGDVDETREAADIDYRLHFAGPEDVEDIAKLIYRVYGYSYVKEDLYYPDRIERALKNDDKFGVIVRTDRGRAVGYFAVLRSTDSEIGEVGEAVVEPDHRRRGLMKRMLEALLDESTHRGLKGAFGEAVTIHTISQRVNQHFGMESCALLLAFHVQERFQGVVDRDMSQPISVVIDFKPLEPYDTVTAYLPDCYALLLRRVYHALGAEVMTPGPEEEPMAGPLPSEAEIDARINYQFKNVELVVESAGGDVAEQALQTIEDLDHEGINVVYVDLPIDDPHTPAMTTRLREQNFVLAGLMPRFHQERDYLRLQLPLIDLSPDDVLVHSDLAHAIKDQIGEELAWSTTEMKMS
jgi:GNAT superfamily N-acetyltransferase/anti-sigma regulatory factor (Ser/Thr protein kinase)